jgi:peptide/nickel transport system substrate-binding protein
MEGLNARISNNPALPAVADRLPVDPLVVVPYTAVGRYGGTLRGTSNGTESGTSDLLSIRHVNLVRFADDLQTVVPNVAKGWEWNADFTVITFTLREGHRWSDGAPFTTADIAFWFEDLILNPEMYPNPPGTWVFGGETPRVVVHDDLRISFEFAVPAQGFLYTLAMDFAQPFQPKHFLAPLHIRYNPQANDEARAQGLTSWVDLVNRYYGNTDWKDIPTPLLSGSADHVMPTLEAYIVVQETSEGRRLVANPYFHMVDTQGNQLPYINEIAEDYVPDAQVRNLRLTRGEIDYKAQGLLIEDFPLFKENEATGGYRVQLADALGELITYNFNTTHPDDALRALFNDVRFKQAMSIAIDRNEINELIYLGQGEPRQATPFEPKTVAFISEAHATAFTAYDPEGARALLAEAGLRDANGDGKLNLADGRPLIVQITYAGSEVPVAIHELVRDAWEQVGVSVRLREVSAELYRQEAANNALDVLIQVRSSLGPKSLANPETIYPPFGNPFGPGTGFGWAVWRATNGEQGIEPPADIAALWDLAEAFRGEQLGSAESNRIGAQIVETHLNNLLRIGLVGNIRSPIVASARLHNVPDFTAKTYDYYWAYPYRPAQWFFGD